LLIGILLLAFATALSLGVTTLELDTGITKDGLVVIAHEMELNSDITRDKNGEWLPARGPAIHSLTYTAVQQRLLGSSGVAGHARLRLEIMCVMPGGIRLQSSLSRNLRRG
jgi:glycerophosphoryl diester phosphodiesterase